MKFKFLFIFASFLMLAAGCDDANIDLEETDTQQDPDPAPPSGVLAVLVISDGPFYDYHSVNVGFTSTHAFTVTNTGAATATGMMGAGLAAPYSFHGGSYPGTGGTCAVTLAAAATCTMVVAYSPVIVGVQSDTIDLDYNDSSSAQTANRSITGTGLP